MNSHLNKAYIIGMRSGGKTRQGISKTATFVVSTVLIVLGVIVYFLIGFFKRISKVK